MRRAFEEQSPAPARWFLWFIQILIVLSVAAAQRIATAFRIVASDLVVFGVGALFVLYLSAVGIYFFEHEAQPESFASVLHSLWWALASLTTVGCGDVYPITVGGRVFTFFVMMIGLGVFAVPTGLIAMAIIKTGTADKDVQA